MSAIVEGLLLGLFIVLGVVAIVELQQGRLTKQIAIDWIKSIFSKKEDK